jgi:thiamine monophosphate synthase
VVDYLKQQQHIPVLAAAGGINPSNAPAYVTAGAQVLVALSTAPRDV